MDATIDNRSLELGSRLSMKYRRIRRTPTPWHKQEVLLLCRFASEARILNEMNSRRNKGIFLALEAEFQKRGLNFSWIQIRTKWKAMKKLYKKMSTDPVNADGWRYYDIMESIMANKQKVPTYESTSGEAASFQKPVGVITKVEDSNTATKQDDAEDSTSLHLLSTSPQVLVEGLGEKGVTHPFINQHNLQSTTTHSSMLQPTTTQSSMLQPTTTQSSMLQPTTTWSAMLQPTTTQSATLQLTTTTQSAILQPAITQSATLQPTTTTQSAMLQPATTQSATLQPTTTQYTTLQPATTQSDTLQPTTTQSAVLQPTGTQSATLQLTASQYTMLQPTTTLPAILQRTTPHSVLLQRTTPKSIKLLRTTPQSAMLQHTMLPPTVRQPFILHPTTPELRRFECDPVHDSTSMPVVMPEVTIDDYATYCKRVNGDNMDDGRHLDTDEDVKLDGKLEEIDSAIEKLIQTIKEPTNCVCSQDNPDAADHFLRSVAADVKKLPLVKRLKLQTSIMELILKTLSEEEHEKIKADFQ